MADSYSGITGDLIRTLVGTYRKYGVEALAEDTSTAPCDAQFLMDVALKLTDCGFPEIAAVVRAAAMHKHKPATSMGQV